MGWSLKMVEQQTGLSYSLLKKIADGTMPCSAKVAIHCAAATRTQVSELQVWLDTEARRVEQARHLGDARFASELRALPASDAPAD